MKNRTFLREAARAAGVDPSNLSKLALKWGVRLSDRAGLLALAAEHRRPSAASIEAVDGQFHAAAQTLAQNVPKLRAAAEQGREIVLELLAECIRLRGGIIGIARLLEPIWGAGNGQSVTLTPEQISAIQETLGNDAPGTLAALERKQETDGEIIAESKRREK